MKKNNITLVFVAIVFSIIVEMIIGKSLLKYKEGEPDVVGSFSIISDNSFVTPVTECVTTSINSVSAETSNAFAIAIKVSSFVTFSPLSITLT